MAWLLGLSQIVGYGTLYYSFAILADNVAASFARPVSWVYGSLSVGLLAGGLVAPQVGHRIDRHGAGLVMAFGSGLSALTLFAAALAPNGVVFAISLVAAQVAAALVQYDAAFTALVQCAGQEAQRRITHLTLIAGFASTIFWPLTAWLDALVGWRGAYLAFAAANLVLCIPIHVLFIRGRRHALMQPALVPPPLHAPAPTGRRRRLLWLATMGFALGGFSLSAILVQMVPMLTALGLGASALVVSTLFGPAQVLIRLVNMVVGVRHHPVVATLAAVGMIPLAIAILLASAPWAVGAALFVALLGFGSGLKSIVQGTLPLALFGSDSYGARLGFMASVRQVMAAVAPFALAVLIETVGVAGALVAVAAVGVAGLACMVEVARVR